MSASLNKVMLIGHVGKDPEMKYMPANVAIANFSVATSESFKDKNGAKQEKTEWHRVIAFGRVAEVMGEYLKKGQQVYVEGKLQTRSWDDAKSGQKRYATEVIALNVQFLGKKDGGATPATSNDEFVPPSEGGHGDEDLPF